MTCVTSIARHAKGKKRVNKQIICATALLVTFAPALHAIAIAGAFNFNGSVTVTQNTVKWTSNSNVNDQATIGSTGLTGNFVGLLGATITIDDLNRATEPVGALFVPQAFDAFNTAPTFPGLLIDFIALGSFPSTDCHNATRIAGQVCTLSSVDVPGGSPFMFTNTASDGVHVDGSTATFSFRGVTSDGLETWNGVFTAQFLESFQDVVNTFLGPSGTVTSTYSAAVMVTPNVGSGTPEPDVTILLGCGLTVIALAARRSRKI
jgi:hypothetical protein